MRNLDLSVSWMSRKGECLGNSLSAMALLARREAAERRVAMLNFMLIDDTRVSVLDVEMGWRWKVMLLILFSDSSFEAMNPLLIHLSEPISSRRLWLHGNHNENFIRRYPFSMPKCHGESQQLPLQLTSIPSSFTQHLT